MPHRAFSHAVSTVRYRLELSHGPEIAGIFDRVFHRSLAEVTEMTKPAGVDAARAVWIYLHAVRELAKELQSPSGELESVTTQGLPSND